jgi:hypothetical protein
MVVERVGNVLPYVACSSAEDDSHSSDRLNINDQCALADSQIESAAPTDIGSGAGDKIT